jgi:hypothetical protein
MQDFTDPFIIGAELYFDGEIDSAFVHYKVTGSQEFEKIPLALSGDSYVAEITEISWSDTLDYYLSASMNNDYVTFPPQGEGGAFRFWFDPSVNIEERALNPHDLIIYPNPAKSHFNYALNEFEVMSILKIFDLKGYCVFETEINEKSGVIDFPKELAGGVYSVRIESSGKMVANKKIVVF